MPGLLGYLQGEPLSADPDKAAAGDAALWSLAAGLLAGRGPAGPTIGHAVQGAMGSYQGLLADALKRKYVESQIAENASQADLRRQQLAQSQRLIDMQNGFLGMLGVPGAPGGAPAPAAGAGGAPAGAMQAPGAQGAAPMPAAGGERFPGVPNMAAAADVIFNQGKGLGGMISKGAEPNISWQNGVPMDNRTGKVAAGFPTIPQGDQNGMYQLVPDGKGGFSVVTPQGSVDVFRQFKDAGARAAADMETVDVTLPGGRAVKMTKSQLADLARQGAGSGAGGPAAPGAAPAGPASGFGTPAEILDGLRRVESGGDPYAINKQSQAMGPYQFLPETIAMLHKQGIRFDPFDEKQARGAADQYLQMLVQRNGGDMNRALAAYGGFVTKDPSGYVANVTGGRQAPAAPGAAAPAPAGRGLEVQSPLEAKTTEARALGNVTQTLDRQKDIANGGIQAASTLSQLSRAEQLFAGLDGGKLTPLSTEVKSALASVGIKGDISKLGAAEAASALAEKMANSVKPPASGTVSDADLRSFQAQVPTLSKTPEGRRQIIATMRAFAERDAHVAQMARDYKTAKGGLDDDFETRLQQWAIRNPIRF